MLTCPFGLKYLALSKYMEEEYTSPASEKPSMLPLILGGLGVVLGLLGIIFAMSAKSNLTKMSAELEQKMNVLAASGNEAKGLKKTIESIESAHNNLAFQVDDIKKTQKSIIEQTQLAFERISSELNKNRDMIAQGAPARPRTTTATGTTADGKPAPTTAGSSNKPASTNGTAAAPAGDGSYVIEKGDTVAKIAKKLGLKQSDIMGANPALEPNKMKVGQTIKLP